MVGKVRKAKYISEKYLKKHRDEDRKTSLLSGSPRRLVSKFPAFENPYQLQKCSLTIFPLLAVLQLYSWSIFSVWKIAWQTIRRYILSGLLNQCIWRTRLTDFAAIFTSQMILNMNNIISSMIRMFIIFFNIILYISFISINSNR